MEDVSVPKVSTVHQGFAGTFTRMDGNDEEEKRREEKTGRDTYEDHKMRTFQSSEFNATRNKMAPRTKVSPVNSKTVKTDALICTDNWTL